MMKPKLSPATHANYATIVSRQRGAVLLIALVVLVAMTLSALALIRSANTGNLVAGNLAFREAALLSAERATESAVSAWLAPHAGKADLNIDAGGEGYYAVRNDPANWEIAWPDLTKKLALAPGNQDSDVAGNAVSYVIHRLCDSVGDPNAPGTNCSRPPHGGDGDSKSIAGGGIGLLNPQVYYRITARVTGPRNTVVYTQTIIAL